MKAEDAFDCAKYNDSKNPPWTNSFQVALVKEIEGKARGFLLASHSREI